MKKALDYYTAGMIIAHNHPSGELKPSKADIDLTKKIEKACALFDIRLLDHLIIAQNSYYSFQEKDFFED